MPVWRELKDWRDLWPAVTTGHRRRLGLILLVLLFLLAFPWSFDIKAPAWAMAESRQLVFAPMAASVADLRPSGPVAKGDTLARFAIPELAHRERRAATSIQALNQRLTGQVANGDLARASFSGDYEPKILRTDTIDGEKMHVLELTAVDRGVTYGKVLYWVRQSNNWPHKAEFYSLSDRLLKVCRYEKFQNLGGRVRPTQLIMEDALRKGDLSTLRYSQMTAKDLPDRVFTKQYMDKLNRVD